MVFSFSKQEITRREKGSQEDLSSSNQVFLCQYIKLFALGKKNAIMLLQTCGVPQAKKQPPCGVPQAKKQPSCGVPQANNLPTACRRQKKTAYAVFFISKLGVNPLKTIVYIDGFNFYYRKLKNSDKKWLNVKAMIEKLLPDDEIVGINYYTARISGRIDADAPRRQQIYFNALKSIENLSIHYGSFSVNESRMFLVQPLDFKHHLKNPNQKIKFANVLKTEEKGSDVNLGCHLVRDGFQGKYEKAVIITNDTDLAEPMRVVKSELNLFIELLSPVDKPARTLSSICDKVTLIDDQSIADSQFEDVIVVGEKNVIKPESW